MPHATAILGHWLYINALYKRSFVDSVTKFLNYLITYALFRCATSSGQDRTTNVDMAILLVTDSENRLTLDRVESFEKVGSQIFTHFPTNGLRNFLRLHSSRIRKMTRLESTALN